MTKRVYRLLQSHRRNLLAAACCIALALPARGQMSGTESRDAGAKSLAFDVVSIHPCKTGSGMSISVHPDSFSARCTTLWGLMYNAFDVRPNDPVAGLPGWADSMAFDVEAKMDGETSAALQKLPRERQWEEHQRMLRAILADRFRLAFHYETRERPIYALVIAKGGPKLSPGDDTKGGGTSWGRGRIDAHAMPLERLAFTLSDVVGREVVDKTGLQGKYDIKLTWTPDELQGVADAGPTLFTAIEEQLGLKLESTKRPVDSMIVDHVEKPTVN